MMPRRARRLAPRLLMVDACAPASYTNWAPIPNEFSDSNSYPITP